MRVDSMNTVPSGARGRDSIRIISTRAYSDSILVLLLTHMPEGCATWPAFWTLSEKGPWPKGGEIDIIEGAHLVSFLLRPIAKLPCLHRSEFEYPESRLLACELGLHYAADP
jgi:hypothetical protein